MSGRVDGLTLAAIASLGASFGRLSDAVQDSREAVRQFSRVTKPLERKDPRAKVKAGRKARLLNQRLRKAKRR